MRLHGGALSCGRLPAIVERPEPGDAAFIDDGEGRRHDEIPNFANDGAQVRFVNQQWIVDEKGSPLVNFPGILRKFGRQGRGMFAWNGRRTSLEGGDCPSAAYRRDVRTNAVANPGT